MPQGLGGEPNPTLLLFAAPGEGHRFLPGSRAFLRRTRLVNSLLGSWPIVFGSGITEEEVWDLVGQELEEGNRGAPLVVLCDSLGADQGSALTQRLRNLNPAVQVLVLVQALRRGQTYRDPRIRERLDNTRAIQLSGREQQVLQGLVRGLSNKQIAQEAEIATITVRDYVSRLCRRLGAANRTQVVTRAIDLGLVEHRG